MKKKAKPKLRAVWGVVGDRGGLIINVMGQYCIYKSQSLANLNKDIGEKVIKFYIASKK